MKVKGETNLSEHAVRRFGGLSFFLFCTFEAHLTENREFYPAKICVLQIFNVQESSYIS